VIDLTGKTFGDWTAISREKGGYWLCQCKCGIETKVEGKALRLGTSTRCRACATPAEPRERSPAEIEELRKRDEAEKRRNAEMEGLRQRRDRAAQQRTPDEAERALLVSRGLVEMYKRRPGDLAAEKKRIERRIIATVGDPNLNSVIPVRVASAVVELHYPDTVLEQILANPRVNGALRSTMTVARAHRSSEALTS
jgi:hypothetical protein